MKRILENVLRDSINGKFDKLTEEEIVSYAREDSNAFISTLFFVTRELLSKYSKKEEWYHFEYVLDYVQMLRENEIELDEDHLSQEISSLDNYIDKLKGFKIQNKKRLIDPVNDFQIQLLELRDNNLDPKVMEYEFIDYLIKEPRNIEYIEYIFEKMPEIIKSKDKEGISLYRNIIRKYMQSMESGEQEKLLYYKRLIQLLLSKKEYKISNYEKKNAITDIQDELNKITNKRKCKEKIEQLKELKDFIASYSQNQVTLDSIAAKYGIQLDFPQEVLDEVKELKPITEEQRQDRRVIEDFIITIDGENTSEIDDALSCKRLSNGNYLLGVHIASILGYFNYESATVQNAFQRGHSIYFRKVMKDNNQRATTRQIAEAKAEDPLEFDPGTDFQYSFSHDVLAALIEAVSGQRFSAYLREHIWEPLHIQGMALRMNDELRENLCPLYFYDPETYSLKERTLEEIEDRFNPEFESGGGGLIGSVAEYIKFADALACGGQGKDGAQILSPEMIQLWSANQLCPQGRRSFDGWHLSVCRSGADLAKD